MAPQPSQSNGVPDPIGAHTPNVARIYDYLLGGKDNFQVDQEAARELLQAVPDASVAAWDNREFLGRAVRFLSKEAGIRQFIDIGTGLPTRANVHGIAQQCIAEPHVAYIDNDPVVLSHARALLAQQPAVVAVEGDLRAPMQILASPEVQALITFDEPIAVLLVAILHFIRDEENPYGIVKQLKEAMPRGSYLVLSHVTGDHLPPNAADKADALYRQTNAPGIIRSRDAIEHFFDGLQLIPPGLVNVASWRADWLVTGPGRTIIYAGVGRKR